MVLQRPRHRHGHLLLLRAVFKILRARQQAVRRENLLHLRDEIRSGRQRFNQGNHDHGSGAGPREPRRAGEPFGAVRTLRRPWGAAEIRAELSAVRSMVGSVSAPQVHASKLPLQMSGDVTPLAKRTRADARGLRRRQLSACPGGTPRVY